MERHYRRIESVSKPAIGPFDVEPRGCDHGCSTHEACCSLGEIVRVSSRWHDPLLRFGLVSALLVLVPVAVAIAQDDSGYGKRGPRLRFDTTVHDFGEIRDDSGKVTYDWMFYNDGDEPLRIVGTRPSCGCTASVVTDDPIPPGGKGVLSVTFDPAGQHGTVRKSLTVSCNDPSEPHVLLTIRAKVEVVDDDVEPGGHPRIM